MGPVICCEHRVASDEQGLHIKRLWIRIREKTFDERRIDPLLPLELLLELPPVAVGEESRQEREISPVTTQREEELNRLTLGWGRGGLGGGRGGKGGLGGG